MLEANVTRNVMIGPQAVPVSAAIPSPDPATSAGARLTLYYPDHFEYYAAPATLEKISSAAAFTLIGDAPNPYGRIPLFHFRPDRRMVKSDLSAVLPIQDAIDMLNLNMIVASEFAALNQKYIVSNADFSEPLRNAPGMIWNFPKGDNTDEPTQVGSFAAADLDNYLKAIDAKLSHLAAITRIPKHYFFQQGGDPSGEALITMESPLVKKVRDRIDRFSVVWRQVALFLLELAGQECLRYQVSRLSLRSPKPSSLTPRPR
jgi:hypothetical protein